MSPPKAVNPPEATTQRKPVLELQSALPFSEENVLPNALLDLRLMPGDCALIETQDFGRAAAFADLCTGMVALRQGEARFMGFNWIDLEPKRAFALRGRIGRIHQRGAWASTLRTHINIMLPQLHHTRRPEAAIEEAALVLARQFGLPGLPLVRPDRLSEADLIRCACVRAFLGDPQLLLLENTIGMDHPELITPMLDMLSQALDRGAAAICFTRDAPLWRAQAFTLSHRLHLLEDGLRPMRGT